jgi:hypothetical protein
LYSYDFEHEGEDWRRRAELLELVVAAVDKLPQLKCR